MSDLDADLLALADGDDSGKEGNVPVAEKPKSESYSPPSDKAHTSAGRSATPKKSRPRAGQRKTKRAQSEDDIK